MGNVPHPQSQQPQVCSKVGLMDLTLRTRMSKVWGRLA